MMHSITRFLCCVLLVTAAMTGGVRPAAAQSPATLPEVDAAEQSSEQTPVMLSLEEAITVALAQNYQLREARQDMDNARAQIREAWGQVMPQVDVSSSYTRDIISANPFAGSDVTSIFRGGASGDWVAFNERARTDGDPNTQPIPFEEFMRRQEQARQDAGIDLSTGDNPFGVDNQFQSGITISQTLYNGSAFAAIRGAQQLKDINERALDRREQLLVRDVTEAFYRALLAQEQVRVSAQSTERTQATLREVNQRVERGVSPVFERTSSEVELANLETQYVQAQNEAGLAMDNLKLTLGIPQEQPLLLRGSLEATDVGELQAVSVDDAVATALQNRPDLQQARLAVELREIDRNITRAEYLPNVSAFANLDYIGRVPDNRSQVVTDPMDPFYYDRNERGFFHSDFWNPSVSAGIQLTWNIFNGFQTTARVEQRQVAVNQAQIEYEQLQQTVQLEVQRALRDLEAARQRIRSQERNVDRAETNYNHAAERVREGVSSQLELREASQQLDQTRYNYLQAVFDYLVARSAYESAVGLPLEEHSALQFTTR